MPPRSSWKGFLNLSLVSVAVKAFTANSEGNQIRLNQLHADCNSRIKHRKTCPKHGPVTNDEIVMGYEYAKDQYVRIDLREMDKLRTDVGVRSIQVETFVATDAVNPMYYTDANYFLVPDGAAGQKPYQLIHQAMKDLDVYCVARAVLQRREQLVLIRPVDRLLCMTVLKYAEFMKSTGAFDDELADIDISPEELKLAKTLISETTDDAFELDQFKDEYTDKLMQVIDAKVNGEEIVAAPAEDARSVINLMDALKASVSKAQEARKPTAATKKKKKQATKLLKASLAGKGSRKKKTKAKKKRTG